MCVLWLRRRRCGFDGLAAAARGARMAAGGVANVAQWADVVADEPQWV